VQHLAQCHTAEGSKLGIRSRPSGTRVLSLGTGQGTTVLGGDTGRGQNLIGTHRCHHTEYIEAQKAASHQSHV
jgi:hypothetical protein